MKVLQKTRIHYGVDVAGGRAARSAAFLAIAASVAFSALSNILGTIPISQVNAPNSMFHTHLNADTIYDHNHVNIETVHAAAGLANSAVYGDVFALEYPA